MRYQRLLPSLFASVLGLSLVFSGTSLNASAADVNIQLDSLSVRGLIGDTLTGYYVDSDRNYKSCVFTFDSYLTMSDRNFTPSGSYASGTQILLLYTTPLPADIGQDLTRQDAIVNIDLGLRLDNVTHIEMLFGSWISAYYTTASYSALNTYNYIDSFAPNLPDASITNGTGYRTSLARRSSDGQLGGYFGINGGYDLYSVIPYKMSSSTAGSLTIDTVQCSCLAEGPKLCFAMSLPYVNPDVVIPADPMPPFAGGGASTGTVSGTISGNDDGTQDIHVTVETDNTGLIGGILSGIKNLFVPTDEDLQGFTDDMHTLAQDHLGGLYEAVDILDGSFSGLSDLSARQSIHVDPVTIPLLGSDTLTLGNWDVPLKPSTSGGFALLYDGIALLVDFIAAFAFLRMCRNKLDIILNPAAEVVSE